MRFLDVGVLLCVALRKPEDHFAGCRALLERLKKPRAEEAVVTTFLTPAVLYFILENRENLPREKITQAIKAIRHMNIRILPLKDGRLMEEAAVIAEKYDVDFDDAVNAVEMRENGIKEIYALDRDYDKLEWVKRITPR